MSDTSDRSDFSGVILAAGEGRRAGGNKLLWPLGDGTVIDTAIEAQATICEKIRVVTGAYYEELKEHISSRHPEVEVVLNERWKSGGMFSSVQLGLLGVSTAAFVQLGDIPGATPDVYRALKSSYMNDQSVDYVKPMFENRGGHPILLSKETVRVVIKADPESNMRAVLANLARTLVPVDEPLIVRDIDTEKQYLEFKSIFKKKTVGMIETEE